MGRFSKMRHIPLAARRLVFRSRVHGAAPSGLVKRGRRLLGNLGCARSGNRDGRQRFRGKSNQEIWRLLRVARTEVELRVRRPKRLQEFVRDPALLGMGIVALFGQIACEAPPSLQGRDGRAMAKPWAHQVRRTRCRLASRRLCGSVQQSQACRASLI